MSGESMLPLQDDEARWIEESRAWVRGHFTPEASDQYESVEGKLRVIDAILANEWVDPSETWKLQSLGIAFGDAISQKLMLDWITVDDEQGGCPALNWPGTSIISFPLTAISKRVEAGEVVDVRRLFEYICDDLCEMAFSGRFV
jgi:hypothetical protein